MVIFCGSTFAAIAGWLINRNGSSRRTTWARSLKFSTAAVVPATLLLVECTLRLIHHCFVRGAQVRPYDFFSVVPCLLWVLIGPVLFAKAFLVRAPGVPRRVFGLQLAQLVSWA